MDRQNFFIRTNQEYMENALCNEQSQEQNTLAY